MKSLTRHSYILPPVLVGNDDAPNACLSIDDADDVTSKVAVAMAASLGTDFTACDERKLRMLQLEADEAFAAANKRRTVALIEQIYNLLDELGDARIASFRV